ncbi:MAG: DMT family transporter [Clostridia bacterium]|nr:DMT family transporter [Clostridia bacterium]
MRKSGGLVCCLLAAFFWGTTFVAQDTAAKTIPAFTFLALRSFVGAAALLVVFLVKDHIHKKRGTFVPVEKGTHKRTLLGGAFCGLFLCAASALQQLGIAGNAGSPGKDAFITALYIVFVPLFGLFLGKRAAPHIYGCVAVALGGLWLLCMNGSALTTGDIQLIICSVLFACQMILVDMIGDKVDAVRLSAMQFLVVGVVSTGFAVILEEPTVAGVLTGWWTVLYAGILSSAVAYTLQIVGQQRTPAALASLVLSLESVVAVIASMIALQLYPTFQEVLGMVLIFAAIIVSQIPWHTLKKAKTAE